MCLAGPRGSEQLWELWFCLLLSLLKRGPCRTHDHAGLQWDTKLGSPSVWMDTTLAPWSGPPRDWGSPPHPKGSGTPRRSHALLVISLVREFPRWSWPHPQTAWMVLAADQLSLHKALYLLKLPHNCRHLPSVASGPWGAEEGSGCRDFCTSSIMGGKTGLESARWVVHPLCSGAPSNPPGKAGELQGCWAFLCD